MSEACSFGSDGQAPCRTVGAFWAADGLALAASPTFAIMALLTAILGGGATQMLCSATQVSPLGGMVAMYLFDERLPRGPMAETDPRQCALLRA